jgi:hypothetical protein
MKTVIEIRTEPKGAPYLDLLSYSAELCDSFSLTWQDQHSFSALADEISRSLRPYLIREIRAKEWPGTRIGGKRRATVRFYRVAPGSLEVLFQSPSLYAWQAPERPEDLCFYLPSGDCFLATIAHEADAFFPCDDLALDDLRKKVPAVDVHAG